MTYKKDGLDKEVVSMAMPDNSGSIDDFSGKKSSRPKKLILEIDSHRPAKTRQQLYEELKKDEEIFDQDVFEYASHLERAIAFSLDILFLYILYKFVIFITPYEFKLVKFFLDSYNLNFILGNSFLLRMILSLTAISAVMIGVIIPMAFFNNSFGKKIINLKVRGDETYSISIEKAILREVIAKPLSIALIVGFILPFFNKEKKSLHDKFVKTFVIRD